MRSIISRRFDQKDLTIKVVVTCKKYHTEKIMNVDFDSITLCLRCYCQTILLATKKSKLIIYFKINLNLSVTDKLIATCITTYSQFSFKKVLSAKLKCFNDEGDFSDDGWKHSYEFAVVIINFDIARNENVMDPL